jgi:hypothetical protein
LADVIVIVDNQTKKVMNNLCMSAQRKVRWDVKKRRNLIYEDHEAPRELGKREVRREMREIAKILSNQSSIFNSDRAIEFNRTAC